MLYECVRVKSLWFYIGLRLNMNITLKRLILGLDCGSLVSDNKNLCISTIAYSIFSTWCKCSFGNTDFKYINLKMEIKNIEVSIKKFIMQSYLQKRDLTLRKC